jgi:hypothetical protein
MLTEFRAIVAGRERFVRHARAVAGCCDTKASNRRQHSSQGKMPYVWGTMHVIDASQAGYNEIPKALESIARGYSRVWLIHTVLDVPKLLVHAGHRKIVALRM